MLLANRALTAEQLTLLVENCAQEVLFHVRYRKLEARLLSEKSRRRLVQER